MSASVIELSQIEKDYPGVKPLDKVDFAVLPGEIHALLGENGAGKSTLIRVMGGVTKPNSGTITYLGKPVSWQSPKAARAAGIHVIHQELALFPELSVAENILVDAQPRGLLGLISNRARHARAAEILAQLGVDIPTHAKIDELPLADQQMVEIAKALVGEVRLLILDEPTAVIAGREVDLLFENMRRLRDEGVGIVYVSHRLEEIFEIADRVTILKDGQLVGTSPVSALTREEMITRMVGRRLSQIYPPRRPAPADGPDVLTVRNLKAGPRVRDVSLNVRVGEIVGVAGMVGSGRTEVAEAIFGTRAVDSGVIEFDGKPFERKLPKGSIGHGLGFLTESRKDDGLFLGLPVSANIVAPDLDAITKRGLIDRKQERAVATRQIQDFSVATPSPDVKIGNLSGGNQQKVLFSRWSRIASKLLILDEPTRGVDIGAKVEIYRIVRRLADSGVGVLMISSELPEIVGLSDRVFVMAQGHVVGEIKGDALGEEAIMDLAVRSVEHRKADMDRHAEPVG
ncbi:sugar ABC transporter ATP-binding protein [Mesorhizobium sp. YC-39]|uniref:sugar ABC transporter ATP-binding protein n=1 Tax=unclassified Mesorhizobium TaxID=325217 RepID=UPI0021E8EDE5|nr:MULTISPECIES: sugar ABC transporter ATP-binding protein [unclassified Mesorhizobium]MCV3210794.1 sugar ABC transporter ATP-binding protein [Mesorhizobium sp. YC-2]MCV3231028.1 sugar ABC transporter ATP-binding protein [Mesorhizobium sp. YC-39]